MDRVLWYLLAGTRGGEMRARILLALRDEPRNANRLAEHLGVDYTTIQHHVRILLKHDVVIVEGDYGAVYFLSGRTEASWNEFGKIWERVRSNDKYGGEKR